MRDELREIIEENVLQFFTGENIKTFIKKIFSWHKSERKKWALNLLAKTYKSWLNSEEGGTFEGAIRKKIEEG